MKFEVALLGSSVVPNSPYGLCGRKATLHSKSCPSGEPVWPSGDASLRSFPNVALPSPSSARRLTNVNPSPNPAPSFSLCSQVCDTPNELQFLTVLQHLLKIDPSNEALAQAVWDAVERLVNKATVLETPEDAAKLLTNTTRRMEASGGASSQRHRTGRGSNPCSPTSEQPPSAIGAPPPPPPSSSTTATAFYDGSSSSTTTATSSWRGTTPTAPAPRSAQTARERGGCQRFASAEHTQAARQDAQAAVAEDPAEQHHEQNEPVDDGGQDVQELQDGLPQDGRVVRHQRGGRHQEAGSRRGRYSGSQAEEGGHRGGYSSL